jgi:phosphate-selective porin OprO/OprP
MSIPAASRRDNTRIGHRRRTVLTLFATAVMLETPSFSAESQEAGKAPEHANTKTAEELLADLEARIVRLERAEKAANDSLRLRLAGAAARAPSDASSMQGTTVRLRGYIQADARYFARPSVSERLGTAILLRRVRPIVDLTNGYFRARLAPDFGDGKQTLQDGYVEVTPPPFPTVRIGKFAPPIGIERLQSSADIRFVELGPPANLVPNRDVGAQLTAAVGERLSIAIGVFNGVPDLGNGDGDADGAKDFVARIFAHPIARNSPNQLVDVGIGIAMSSGSEHGSLTAPALPSYKTDGQQSVFRFRGDGSDANTVVADGVRRRIVPQTFVTAGPVAFLAEHVTATQSVRRAGETALVTNRAWQAAVWWAMSGERETYANLAPNRSLGTSPGAAGAFELVARVGALDIGSSAFPVFADSTQWPGHATTWSAGVNWRPAIGVTVMLDFEHTTFGSATVARQPERVILTRLQTAF